jgi:DNA primase
MAKYTKRVVISYDSDEAGQRAASRAMAMLGAVGLEVRILVLEGAKDPDEYIKKFGVDRFRQALSDSATGFEYKFRSVMAKHDISVSEEKIRASQALCEIVAGYYTPTEREVYLHKVAEALSLPIDVLRNNTEIILRKRKKRNQGAGNPSGTGIHPQLRRQDQPRCRKIYTGKRRRGADPRNDASV